MAAPTAPAASTLPQRWQRVPSSSVLYDVITNTRDEWEAAHPNWRNRHDADEQADARAAFVDTAVHALVPVVPAPFTLDELIAHAHAVATRWNADNPDAIAANAAMPPVISISGAAHRTYASMFLMTVSDIHSWENVLGLSNVTDDYVILAAEAELGSWIDTPAGRADVLAPQWTIDAFRSGHTSFQPRVARYLVTRIAPHFTRDFMRSVRNDLAYLRDGLAARNVTHIEPSPAEIVAWLDGVLSPRAWLDRSRVTDLITQRAGGPDVANEVASFLPDVYMLGDDLYFTQRGIVSLSTDRVAHEADPPTKRTRKK
jgi:hypothetical protein